MSKDTHYRVALEFDFPEALVRHILRRQSFKDAGSFIDYLETYMEELEAKGEKFEEIVEAVDNLSLDNQAQGATASLSPAKLTLREETERLYRKSKCLICVKKSRACVLLPCCHLALCSQCEPRALRCPVTDCGEKIKSVIPTYFS